MAVWIALGAVFIALIPALLVARAKANTSAHQAGDGGGSYIADSSDSGCDGGDGGGCD